jgi:hypothetical protein
MTERLDLSLASIAPRGSDGLVLSLAYAYQPATAWRYIPPPRMK